FTKGRFTTTGYRGIVAVYIIEHLPIILRGITVNDRTISFRHLSLIHYHRHRNLIITITITRSLHRLLLTHPTHLITRKYHVDFQIEFPRSVTIKGAVGEVMLALELVIAD